MYSFEAIQLLIFLVPGFISQALLSQFTVRKDKSELKSVVEALIFSLVIYTVYSLTVSKSPVELTVINTPNSAASTTYSYDGIRFLWLFVISLLMPIMLSFLITNDVYMRVLRFTRLSRRTARDSTWLDVFLDYQRYVVVNFTDGRRIKGWPKYYSDDPEKQYLYLTEPVLIIHNEQTKADEYQDLDEEGVLITPNQKIESIVFLKEKND